MSTIQTINVKHPSAASNIALDASGNASLTGSLAMGSSFLRNRIINGSFDVWQRGTSGFTSGYFADRFFLGGASPVAARSTDVPSGFRFSASLSGSGFPILYQRIESVNTTDLPGQSVTISFWLKQTTGAGTGAFSVGLFFPTATDNYASATQIETWRSVDTTASWARYTFTFTGLPSGVANGLALGIGSASSGSSATLITGVQLEVGSVATPFERRLYGHELALCQRYFFKTFQQETAPAQNVGSTLGALHSFGPATNVSFTGFQQFPVTMRASPTLTTFAPDQASANWSDQAGARPTATAGNAGNNACTVRGTTSVNAGGQYAIHLTASAEL